MKDKAYDLGYYNPIYREISDLLRDTIDKAIFDKVWHEYVARVRCGKSLYFQLKSREIGRRTEIGHSIVSAHIKGMVKIGILLDDGDSYSVAGDYVLSLLNAYRQLKTYEDQKEFRLAIAQRDMKSLEEFGFVFYKGITSELKYLSGKSTDGRDLTQVGEIQPSRLGFEPVGYDNGQLAIIRASWLDKMRDYICQNYTTGQIIDASATIIGSDSSQLAIIRATQDIFSDNEKLSADAESLLIILAGSLMSETGSDSSHPLAIIRANAGHYPSHSKYKEDSNNEKNEGDPEGPYNKGEDKDEIEKVDEGLIGDEIPRFNINEDLYKLAKKKAKLPYFNSQEVTEIINNIEVAIQREDKLFIHQLWEELSIYCTEEVDGDEIPRKIEGYEIFADQLHCILKPAFETTNEIIQQGYVSFNGEEIPVSIEKELDPEAVDLIIDWEKIKTEENTFVKVSQARLKNIYGEEVEAVRKKGRRRTDADRERINSYYRQFILAGNDQEKLDGLSDIECAIFDFIDQFFKVDWENGEITGLGDNFQERNFLTASEFNQFIFQVSDKYGITREDFLSVVNEKPDLDGNLTVSERMLNVDGIQAWNKKHSQESSIKI